MARMRLDKLLSALAVCPRSGVTALLRAGRVRVDGAAAKDAGMAVDPDVQIVTLDDQALEWKAQRTVMLNKPCGVLTAARDPKQPTVLDLLPPLYRAMNCMPAGRLDKDTEGLLILTTDGQLAHRLISPKREVGKLYEAEVDGPLGADDVAAVIALILSSLSATTSPSVEKSRHTSEKPRSPTRAFLQIPVTPLPIIIGVLGMQRTTGTSPRTEVIRAIVIPAAIEMNVLPCVSHAAIRGSTSSKFCGFTHRKTYSP